MSIGTEAFTTDQWTFTGCLIRALSQSTTSTHRFTSFIKTTWIGVLIEILRIGNQHMHFHLISLHAEHGDRIDPELILRGSHRLNGAIRSGYKIRKLRRPLYILFEDDYGELRAASADRQCIDPARVVGYYEDYVSSFTIAEDYLAMKEANE